MQGKAIQRNTRHTASSGTRAFKVHRKLMSLTCLEKPLCIFKPSIAVKINREKMRGIVRKKRIESKYDGSEQMLFVYFFRQRLIGIFLLPVRIDWSISTDTSVKLLPTAGKYVVTLFEKRDKQSNTFFS